MKTFILSIFLICNTYAAELGNQAENFVAENAGVETLNLKAINEGYAILELAVSEDKYKEDIKAYIALTILMLKKEPSQYAIEVIYPAYIKHRKETIAIVESLPKDDRVLFFKALINHERELKEGNG
jgi:hypothetical protein